MPRGVATKEGPVVEGLPGAEAEAHAGAEAEAHAGAEAEAQAGAGAEAHAGAGAETRERGLDVPKLCAWLAPYPSRRRSAISYQSSNGLWRPGY